MDKALMEFFSKKGLLEPERKLTLSQWVMKAAGKASQLTLATHNGKYTHTSAKKNASCIALPCPRISDGYLRTGNCEMRNVDTLDQLDCLGNAAALDVYSFLSIVLDDSYTVFHHIQQRSKSLQRDLEMNDDEYRSACEQFVSIKPEIGYAVTQDVIKQVYFPVGEGYHLLSVLTSSVLVSEMNKRINLIRFSDQAQEGRKFRGVGAAHEGYDELYDLTEIGYGGANSQNAGILNARSGGSSLLLPSFPPVLHGRRERLPRRDFFITLNVREFAADFRELRDIAESTDNNLKVRNRKDEIFGYIIDRIIQKSLAIRSCEGGWSGKDSYAQLPEYQKIWLDLQYAEQREKFDEWLETLIGDMSRWILKTLASFRPDKKIPIDDVDFRYVKKLIRESKGGLL